MANDRAEGTSSGNASGNPSAVLYIEQSYFDILEDLNRQGFADAKTGESAHLMQRVSQTHLAPYLSLVKRVDSGRPTVQRTHDLLSFDRKYQAILFKYIGVVEAQMRAQYSHRMETAHGEYALYDASLFLRRENYEKTLSFYQAEVQRKARRSWAMRSLIERSGGRLPIASGVECVTLGTLSQLFANTADARVTRKVAESFGCTKSELSSWLKTITDVGNVCAHFDSYAVRRQIPSNPLKIADMPESDNKSTFYIVLLLLHLMEQKIPSNDLSLIYTFIMRREIRELVESMRQRLPGMLPHLGFPNDWKAQMDYAGGGQIVFAVKRTD